jgi:hypothetical protein
MKFRNLIAGVTGLLLAVGTVRACGYHGVADGFRTSHPKSLEVAFALHDVYDRGRLQPLEPLPATEGLARANLLLARFTRTLADDTQAPFPLPEGESVAVLLVEQGLWSRFTRTENAIKLSPHIDGPAPGERVIITGESVIEGLVTRKLTTDHVQNLGVLVMTRSPAMPDDERRVDRSIAQTRLGFLNR